MNLAGKRKNQKFALLDGKKVQRDRALLCVPARKSEIPSLFRQMYTEEITLSGCAQNCVGGGILAWNTSFSGISRAPGIAFTSSAEVKPFGGRVGSACPGDKGITNVPLECMLGSSMRIGGPEIAAKSAVRRFPMH